jgi:bifunctional non-homologous end joining protein LigD
MAETRDPLQRYHDKRDFDATPEPRGRRGAPRKALGFVVQKHAARRLHYDFRLELDGTLKSWAVPKGPSFDPTQKRMAVHVEDHPLEYGGFEGTIPQGHYGAGEVIVWDRGTWQPHGDPDEGMREGKLKFALDGEKLHGEWTLVRMKPREGERQEAWLLIKERDAAARPEAEYSVVEALPDSVLSARGIAARPTGAATKRTPAKRGGAARKAATGPALPALAVAAALPKTFAPALATLVDAAPPGAGWLYEVKFDGYRMLARVDGEQVQLFTRNGHDWTGRLPKLAQSVAALGLGSAWLDGEIVALDARGVPNFQALQNAFDSSRGLEQLRYYVFDLPYYAARDLRAAPLTERRALLAALLEGAPPDVRFSEVFDAPGADLLASACELGLEGLIGKRADAAYPRGRSKAWIKLKCVRAQEFVIGGYTDPQGSRTGLGSLLLGVHDEAGALRYAGNVGTGFDGATLDALERRLRPLQREATPFAEKKLPPSRYGARAGAVHWVEPTLLAEVSFAEWTDDGRVRHAVFKGLREDKPARAIVREQAAPPAAVAASATDAQAAPAAPRAAARKAAPRSAAAKPAAALRVTHPERVVDAASGATKGRLIDYFARAAEVMLPHLRERPVALLRAPDGLDAAMFFQKHAEPRQLRGLTLLDPKLDPGRAPLLGIDSAEALLNAAQMNVIEIHTWNATTRAIEQPDRMVFDLDPGEGVGWREVVEAAQLVHGLLDALGLASFLKSSGGKGLHVVVPLTPREDWATVKDFSHAVVDHLAAHAGQRFVAKSGPKNRVGRIFVDYLRNGRGATTVAAYSVRARPGLGISLPLAWEELAALKTNQIASIDTSTRRLEEAAATWHGYFKTRQTLAKAMKTLGFVPAPRGRARKTPA